MLGYSITYPVVACRVAGESHTAIYTDSRLQPVLSRMQCCPRIRHAAYICKQYPETRRNIDYTNSNIILRVICGASPTHRKVEKHAARIRNNAWKDRFLENGAYSN